MKFLPNQVLIRTIKSAWKNSSVWAPTQRYWFLWSISWGLPDGSLVNSFMQSDDSGGRTKRYVVFNNGTLYFNEVGLREEGDYTCFAENQVGKDEMRVRVKVVTEPAVIRNKTYSVVQVPYGDVVTVACEAKGEPTPRVTWLSPTSRQIDLLENSFMFCLPENVFLLPSFLMDVGLWIDSFFLPPALLRSHFCFLKGPLFFSHDRSSIFLTVLLYVISFFCCFQGFLFMRCLNGVFFVLPCLGFMEVLGCGSW